MELYRKNVVLIFVKPTLMQVERSTGVKSTPLLGFLILICVRTATFVAIGQMITISGKDGLLGIWYFNVSHRVQS